MHHHVVAVVVVAFTHALLIWQVDATELGHGKLLERVAVTAATAKDLSADAEEEDLGGWRQTQRKAWAKRTAAAATTSTKLSEEVEAETGGKEVDSDEDDDE